MRKEDRPKTLSKICWFTGGEEKKKKHGFRRLKKKVKEWGQECFCIIVLVPTIFFIAFSSLRFSKGH